MNILAKDDEDIKHLHSVLRHIENVRDNCHLLGDRLVQKGEKDLGIDLIGLGLNHDVSKIHNRLEFKYLRNILKGTPEFELAAECHITSNAHHPEYWRDIKEMPRLYIAEMVCDWKSRSEEFGNDVREWIKDKASKKFGFSLSGQVYKDIKMFLDILLDEAFKD